MYFIINVKSGIIALILHFLKRTQFAAGGRKTNI